jgi:hypothetical protein
MQRTCGETSQNAHTAGDPETVLPSIGYTFESFGMVGESNGR